MSKERSVLSRREALTWLLSSVLIIAIVVGVPFFYYQYLNRRYRQDNAFRIVAIVQTSPSQEMLQTKYLAELLELSMDRPTNLYAFDTRKGRDRLLANPLIREASVSRIRPGTIHVDYLPRQPIAFLLDYTNTALDEEGYLFPFKPFFTPKKLPEVYLGMGEKANLWGTRLTGKKVELAFFLLRYLHSHCGMASSAIRRIDVSRIDDPRWGQREIVLIVENQWEKEAVLLKTLHVLRLGIGEYQQALANYVVLRKYLMETLSVPTVQPGQTVISLPTLVIDLRLPSNALIKKG